MLGGFLRLAKQTLTKPGWLQLSCVQFFADEAGDAVHESLSIGKHVMSTAADARKIPYEVRAKHLGWDSNSTGVLAFAPMCNEEGWAEAQVGEEVDWESFDEGGTTSPVACVEHLANGTFRATWLGALHRPWLDFPGAMTNREADGDEELQFATDPAPVPLAGTEPELYAQVLADPGNDTPREVLRDAWLARGDVRGEFSALSTAKKLDAKMIARAAALVLEHGRGWLGPLAAVIPSSGALFGPGPFVRKAIVYAASAKDWAKVAKSPAWATVEELAFANGSHRALSPMMKNLASVGPLAGKELVAFETGTWRVRELDVEVDAIAMKKLPKLALPIERLRLRADKPVALAAFAKAPWWDTLERIELWLPGTTEDPATAMAHAFATVAKGAPCPVAVGVLANHQRSGWMIEGTATKRALVLHRPDARPELGSALAKATKLKLPTRWTPATGDDWLTFALGASIATKLTTA
jgi:hypothetical protein